ncbi:UDP-glycosyltransferase UGT5-like [Aethina tumida]|uniref:UDP-glycosyltransferase UGT5-like n=1 Tax=Aethina tumida TaxID=116153 RepID=UPI002147DF9E|nr:UDP-glycosyltransferase UGT5-like [Aethina tumida]
MVRLFLILLLVNYAHSANIFFFNSLCSKSHFIWNYALASGLIAKGHNVTFFDAFAKQKPETDLYHPVDYKYYTIEGDPEGFPEGNLAEQIIFYMVLMGEMCDFVYKSEQLDSILRDKDKYKFDLVITDFTIFPCGVAPLHAFPDIPVVGVTPFLLPPEFSHIFGNNLQPAYIPQYFSVLIDNMSFMERVYNFLGTYWTEIVYYYYWNEFEEAAVKKYGLKHAPYMKNVDRISLLLSNTNPLLDYPQPLPPNIIPVGGLQAKPAQKLPEDLQKIMDNSKDGIIVFSLGTNMRSDKISPEKRKALLEAFKQLKQTVLWKFESDIKGLPKNVIVRKWLPQNDVIAHPDVVLFIGHGGALSTQEALFHGVPIIGIPFIFDQIINVKSLQQRQHGALLDYKTMTTKQILNTIHEVLNNPIYRKNVKELSERFKSLPSKPLDTAVEWIEYSLKHNGTSFLNLKSRHMSFLQYTCLDVILFLIGVVVAICWIVRFSIHKILNLLCNNLKQKKKCD